MNPRSILTSAAIVVAVAAGSEIALRIGGLGEPLALVTTEHGLIDPSARPRMLLDEDLLWVHPGYAAELAAAAVSRPAIVFLGDASTQNSGYPRLFREIVNEAHAPRALQVANLGVHASSTSQGRALLERDALPLQPRVVAFYYGWTDHFLGLGDHEILRIGAARRGALSRLRWLQLLERRELEALRAARSDTSRRVPKAIFAENLRAMVRQVRAQEAIPLLLSAPTSFRPGRTPKGLRGFYLSASDDIALLHSEYVDIVRRVAAEENVLLCDLHAHFERMTHKQAHSHFVDGIHPNPKGDAQIARLLYECVERAGELGALLD